MSSIKQQAVKGTIWTLIGYGGAQALRLGSNLILTRLLVPELFGLMALVQAFITGLALFSDIGIRPAIIRSPRWEEKEFLNTAWTMQVIRGFWVWLCCIVLAWPISRFYDDPRLLWLIPLVGSTVMINGFNSTSFATLNRKLDIGKLTQCEFVTQALAILIMIVWAYFSPTIWALVVGNIASAFIKTIWSHYLEAGSVNRFGWDKTAVTEIMTFGGWVFVSTVMTFLASQADRLILGKLLSLEMLGIYTIAFTFADLPRQIIHQINRRVMFPVISRYIDLDRKSLRAKILKKRRFLLLGLILVIAFLAGFGDFLVLGLYDDRYQDAAWMLPILALGLWPLLLALTIDRALYAIGNPQFVAFGHFLKFLYMVVLLPTGFNVFGVLGAVLVIAFNDLPSYVMVNIGLVRENLSGIKQDLQATVVLIGMLAVVLGGRYALGLGSPIDGLLNLL
ncbi:MAG: oligosaccharide flippase family protein [Microcoleaceae cyanobacterium]